MILVDYKLRDFKEEFNKKKRRHATDKTKFKVLKTELLEHLKKFDKTLHVLPELKIYIENNVLYFSYIETTGTRTKFSLNWKVYEFVEEEWNQFIAGFCLELETKENVETFEIPIIEYADKNMGNTYGLYFPDLKKIIISKRFIEENKNSFIKQVLMHEIIHHFCYIHGLGATDVDNDFIRLIIKYKAYVSLAPEAQQAYHYYQITHGNSIVVPNGAAITPSLFELGS